MKPQPKNCNEAWDNLHAELKKAIDPLRAVIEPKLLRVIDRPVIILAMFVLVIVLMTLGYIRQEYK